MESLKETRDLLAELALKYVLCLIHVSCIYTPRYINDCKILSWDELVQIWIKYINYNEKYMHKIRGEYM